MVHHDDLAVGPIRFGKPLMAVAFCSKLAVFCVHRIERVARARRQKWILDGSVLEAAHWPELRTVARLAPGRGRLGQPALVRRDDCLFRAGQHRVGDDPRRGSTNRLFAAIDLAVGLLSLATQVFATAEFLKRFGTGIFGRSFAAIYVVGFGSVGDRAEPVGGGDTSSRAALDEFCNRKSGTPGVLHVVGREEKYKAKNLIDVVIYRGSDALYGWVYDSLQALGLKLGAIALCALPVAAGWLVLSTRWGERRSVLRRKQTTKERRDGNPNECRITRQITAATLPHSLADFCYRQSCCRNEIPLSSCNSRQRRAYSRRWPWYRLCFRSE